MGTLLEHLAVIFSAATGPLVARGKGIDLFGMLVLGFVTAVGGGTLRDLLLHETVFWIRDGRFLISAVGASGLAFYVAPQLAKRERWFLLPDALGLAFVTMLGTAKAQRLGYSPEVCLVMGIMTGVAGGVLRDVLIGEVPIVFRPHINLYATAAACGALCFLVLRKYQLLDHSTSMIVGVAVILILRLAALRWKWRLPGFDGTDVAPPDK